MEHHIKINRPIQNVWNEAIDVENWPQWAATMTQIQRMDSGPFGLGSKALVKQPAQPKLVWVVTKFQEGSHFEWSTKLKGVHFSAGHFLTREKQNTLCELTFHVGGPLGFLVAPLVFLPVRWAITNENAALKKWCENQYPSRSHSDLKKSLRNAKRS